ncbi:hypothetical protein Mesil_3082 [Allomeiothermus silvanus DSM 9946]|uniref:AB hydrolase-1 domain-containing protein n=1 Tax=Allomeiothermus silvanus (strain ATCC 700542 / DSM 9946 / NBRC 106475 / NCIMB 13440 / VI-R2) TaxID=526227 RepID=D7BE58_ALLS1|nr:hypothetical protein Mesil_3082 [Allomeiothermus silvanus DSM 9946]
MRPAPWSDASGPLEGFIPLENARLFYREIGQGQPVIVLHGGPDFDHTYLLPDTDRLARWYRLIYYDQRGRGRSAAGVRPEDVSLGSDVEDLESLRSHFRLALLGAAPGGVGGGAQRGSPPVHHDQGGPFLSHDGVGTLLLRDGQRVSYSLMGAKGNPMMESFGEGKELFREAKTLAELKEVVRERLRYSPEGRLHAGLGYRTPREVGGDGRGAGARDSGHRTRGRVKVSEFGGLGHLQPGSLGVAHEGIGGSVKGCWLTRASAWTGLVWSFCCWQLPRRGRAHWRMWL